MCSPWQSGGSPEINDLAALRRQGYGLFAAKIGFRSHNNFCDLNHKMAVLNRNLAGDDDDDDAIRSGKEQEPAQQRCVAASI